jgi:hypothetical protein
VDLMNLAVFTFDDVDAADSTVDRDLVAGL